MHNITTKELSEKLIRHEDYVYGKTAIPEKFCQLIYDGIPYMVDGINLDQTDFSLSNLKNITFSNCSFNSAVFDEAVFQQCHFIDCNIDQLSAVNSYFYECHFKHCYISSSKFDQAHLINSTLRRCMLKRSCFVGLTCQNTYFPQSSSLSNNIDGIKIFLDAEPINEWRKYELEIRSFFTNQRTFKSKDQKKKEQQIIKQQIKIIEYANSLGFHVIKRGKYYSLREHDSVIIDNEKNCFWRNSNGAKGSVIDFAIEFTHKDVSDIIQEFSRMINFDDISYSVPEHSQLNCDQQKKVVFTLPERDKTIKNIYAYLLSVRMINKNIVSLFLARKYLYQDIKKNCVFVSYKKDKPVYATKRGTNTDYRFVGDVPGSDYNWCFFIDHHSDILIVTESVIDAMSVMSILLYYDYDIESYDYLALTGTQKYDSIYYHDNIKPYKKIYLALDNDNGGVCCSYKIRQHVFDHPVELIDWMPKDAKDWNDICKCINTGIKCNCEVPL